MKKKLDKICRVILYVLIILMIVCGATIIWLMHTWANLSYAELLFHLKSSISGTSTEMIVDALIKYALPAFILMAVIVILCETILKKKKSYLVLVLVFLICIDSKIIYEFDKRTSIITDITNSVFKTNESDFIEENFTDTSEVEITFPEKKRNLIYIYLESAEITCADEKNGGAFEKNVIPNLTELSKENENFAGYENDNILNGAITLPGTEWTMGGMFAQSSGLPLKIALGGNSFGGDLSTTFFPQITTIGDILDENGYKNTILMGSDANFAGRKLFYETHGNYDIHDLLYAREVGWLTKDYYCFWGFEDYKLFTFAKNDLLNLVEQEQPFNYTILTVDTHFEDGYYCDLCGDEFGDNQYANVFACADRQVSSFIEWVQQQDFYENTTIVLCGDHLTMDSDFYENINQDYQRKTYTCIINGAAVKKNDSHREYGTIDMFPTTLAALGATMSSDRLGVGTNLYSDTKTLIEEYGLSKCADEFKKTSPFLENMAGLKVDEDVFEKMRDDVYLETANEGGKIRFRIFKMSGLLKYESVNAVLLTVDNTKTGESNVYNVELVKEETGQDFYGVVHSDKPYDELMDLDCKLYISAGEFDNYLLKHFTSDMFEVWDIRWD